MNQYERINNCYRVNFGREIKKNSIFPCILYENIQTYKCAYFENIEKKNQGMPEIMTRPAI